jgi:peptidoglycan-associated lipoprotein
MNPMKLTAALAAFALAGCAHQAATATPTAMPTTAPVAQATAPAPATAPEQPETQDDLAKLLSQAVVHFDFDQDVLRPEGREKLDQLADALKSHPKATVRISGNCDELGTEEYNLALGQRRAEVAKKYLVSLGVPSNRIKTVSYGKERPANPAHTQEAYAENRRDEVAPSDRM